MAEEHQLDAAIDAGMEESDDTNRPVPDWIPTEIMSDPITGNCLHQLFSLSSGMHKLQKDNVFCDLTIHVGETTFYAHKVVLASSSEYFQVMLRSDFKEGRESEATISGAPEAFQILLNFIYSAKLVLTSDTVIEVMEMAHYLQIGRVMELCESFLHNMVSNEEVDLEMVMLILSKADMFGIGDGDLKEGCKKYLAEHFMASDLFLQHMTAALLEEVLGRWELLTRKVVDEKEIFDTTVAWLKHDWEDRKQHTLSLFQKIRLGTIPVGHLSMALLKLPDLYSIPECEQLIDKVMKLTDSRKPYDAPLHKVDPSLFSARTTVTAILGIDQPAQFYDTELHRWVELTNFPPLPPKDCRHTVDNCFEADGNLYVARGAVVPATDLLCPQFLRLDVANNRWETLSPMRKMRDNPGLVFLDGKIYAFGGSLIDRKSCEVYSIKENTWSSLPPMPYFSLDGNRMSCAVHNGKILVMSLVRMSANGGYQLQVYNPVTNSWFRNGDIQVRSPLRSKCLVTCKEKCYFVSAFSCNCGIEECQQHVNQIRIRVRQLLSHADDENRSQLVGGNRQDQAVLPPGSMKDGIFCISEDLFVICKRKIYSLGTKIDDIKGLTSLRRVKTIDQSYKAGLITTFTFDKARWI